MPQEMIDSLTTGLNRRNNLRQYLRKLKLKDRKRKRKKESDDEDFIKIKKVKEFLDCMENGIGISTDGNNEFAILKSTVPDNDIDRDTFSETSSVNGASSRPRRLSVAPQRFVFSKEKRPVVTKKSFDPDTSFEVEAIKKMSLVKTEVFFFVKWENYSSKENTWEPLENVRECEALERFLDYERSGEEENIALMCKELLEDQQDEVEAMLKTPKKMILKELQKFDPLQYKCFQLIYKITKDQLNYYLNFRKIFQRMVVLDHFHQMDVKQYVEHRKISREFMLKEMDAFTISINNEVDFEIFPKFEYIKENQFPEGLAIDQAESDGCKCKDGCSRDSKCCPTNLKANFAYKWDNTKQMRKKLRLNHIQLIVECGKACMCDDLCLNRVTQQPRKFPLQIFKTSDSRGWGLKAKDRIPKDSFIIEYTGEVLNQEESIKRGEVYDQIGQSYLFDLDFNEDAEAVFTIDAFKSGNLSRLINHSCEPNCKIWPVTTLHQDSSKIYKLCYFSTRLINEGEEITFDYSGGTFEKPEVDEEFGAQGNSIGRRYKTTDECKCGAKSCRGFIFA